MEPTDIELMLRVREGDVAAFRALASRHREPLKRFFISVLADRSLADDYAQETLLRVWQSRERYVPSGSFTAYLFQVARHFWWNQRKKIRRDLTASPLDWEGAESADTPGLCADPEALVLARARFRQLLGAVMELPSRYRLVFELVQFEALSYAEVAAQLGIPIGTVKSRMSEALRRLRCALETLDNAEDLEFKKGDRGDEETV